jgi:hypothetical protein
VCKTVFAIREAAECDIPALTALELAVWEPLGMRPMSSEDLQRWYEANSPFFLVAERDDLIVGYYFGQYNDFDLDRIDEYTKIDMITGKGYINLAHDPCGDSLYGISIVSTARGAGSALYEIVRERLESLKKKYYFGFCRLAKLKEYLDTLPPEFRLYAESQNADAIALWYAHECIQLIGGKIWGICTPKPEFALPHPPIDPVLLHHARSCAGQFGLVRVVPRFMDDRESKGYVAFLVYEVGK